MPRDEQLDQVELDPRWEIQPEPHENDTGSHGRALLVALVSMAIFAAMLSWLFLNVHLPRPG